MPKVQNSRKFLKSIRQSTSPLEVVAASVNYNNNDNKISTTSNSVPIGVNDVGTDSLFSLSDYEQFSQMRSTDLLEVIKDRLRHTLPSERCIGTDMIQTFFNETRLNQELRQQKSSIIDIIKLLSLLLLDRAENVRFGAIQALW